MTHGLGWKIDHHKPWTEVHPLFLPPRKNPSFSLLSHCVLHLFSIWDGWCSIDLYFFNSGYTNIKGKLVQRAHWVLYFNDGDGALNRPAKMSLTGSTSDPQNCFGSEVQKPKNWTIERFNPSLRIGGTAALTTELRLAFFVTGVVPSCLLWAGYNVAALWGLSRLDWSAAGGSLLPFSGLGGSGFPAPVLKFSEWWWLLSIACRRSPESAWYAPLL